MRTDSFWLAEDKHNLELCRVAVCHIHPPSAGAWRPGPACYIFQVWPLFSIFWLPWTVLVAVSLSLPCLCLHMAISSSLCLLPCTEALWEIGTLRLSRAINYIFWGWGYRQIFGGSCHSLQCRHNLLLYSKQALVFIISLFSSRNSVCLSKSNPLPRPHLAW